MCTSLWRPAVHWTGLRHHPSRYSLRQSLPVTPIWLVLLISLLGGYLAPSFWGRNYRQAATTTQLFYEWLGNLNSDPFHLCGKDFNNSVVFLTEIKFCKSSFRLIKKWRRQRSPVCPVPTSAYPLQGYIRFAGYIRYSALTPSSPSALCL